MCIVFLPNPPIAILELPNCLSHEWLTFLKRCYWLVRQEYNNHVTMKVLIINYDKIQNKTYSEEIHLVNSKLELETRNN